MPPWHEQDEFWVAMAPLMFGPNRRAGVVGEIDGIVTMLAITPPCQILDLCCGPGRHALELDRRGFDVVGVDRTAAYLDRARAATGDASTARFVQDDMRHFCRPDSFDAAVNLYTSFGYFEDPEDDRTVLRNVFHSLRPGGRFLMDLLGKEVLARGFRERDWREQDGITLLEERKLSRDWGWIDCRWIRIDGAARHEFTLSHRLYSGAELTAVLRECGFGDVRLFGNLSAAPYDHQATRLIALARKPG